MRLATIASAALAFGLSVTPQAARAADSPSASGICDRPLPGFHTAVTSHGQRFPSGCMMQFGRRGGDYYSRTLKFSGRGGDHQTSLWWGPYPSGATSSFCQLVMRPLGCWQG